MLERAATPEKPPPLPETMMSVERLEALNKRLLQDRASKAHVTPLTEAQWLSIAARVAQTLRDFDSVPMQQRTPHQKR
jgi:hypothetical protein